MSNGDKPTTDGVARTHMSLALQFAGVVDIVVGGVIAIGGPLYFDNDPDLTLILPIAGGVLALAGLGLWWYARFIYARGN